MKIAVLLVGEFRTFESTRKTMGFLGQTDADIDIDVYFHTWSTSTTVNPVRSNVRGFENLQPVKVRNIDHEIVSTALNVPAVINISDIQGIDMRIVMITGWKIGFDQIKQSGKKYDYVLMLRPDLFFSSTAYFDAEMIIKNFENKRAIGVMPVPHPTSTDVSDGIFFASFQDMDEMISDIIEYFENTTVTWHHALYNYLVKNKKMEIFGTPVTAVEALIGRFPMDKSTTWEIAFRQWWEWYFDREGVTICTYGNFEHLYKARQNYKFLFDGQAASNLLFLNPTSKFTDDDLDIHYARTYSTSKIEQFLKSEGILKYTYDNLVITDIDFNASFENFFSMWQKCLTTYADDVSFRHMAKGYIFMIRSDLVFDYECYLKISNFRFSSMPSSPESINIAVSIGADGLYNTDIIFGYFSCIKELLCDDLLSKWQTESEKYNGNWKKWWDYYLRSNYRFSVHPLPITCKTYRKCSVFDSIPAIYQDIETINDEIINFKKNILPRLKTSSATIDSRTLALPNILKRGLYHLSNMLVAFDLDGVLLESKDMHYETLNSALGEIDNRYVIDYREHLSRFDGLPTKKKLNMLSAERGLPENVHEIIWKLKQQHTIKWIENMVYDDDRIRNIFLNLKSLNCTIAVASNSIRETVIAALTKLDLIDLVDLVVSNEDVKNPKPHPEMYWKCMTHFGKIPAKTLIIEDSSVGLAAAYASGAMVLKVNRPMDITLALLEESVNKSL